MLAVSLVGIYTVGIRPGNPISVLDGASRSRLPRYFFLLDYEASLIHRFNNSRSPGSFAVVSK